MWVLSGHTWSAISEAARLRRLARPHLENRRQYQKPNSDSNRLTEKSATLVCHKSLRQIWNPKTSVETMSPGVGACISPPHPPDPVTPECLRSVIGEKAWFNIWLMTDIPPLPPHPFLLIFSQSGYQNVSESPNSLASSASSSWDSRCMGLIDLNWPFALVPTLATCQRQLWIFVLHFNPYLLHKCYNLFSPFENCNKNAFRKHHFGRVLWSGILAFCALLMTVVPL